MNPQSSDPRGETQSAQAAEFGLFHRFLIYFFWRSVAAFIILGSTMVGLYALGWLVYWLAGGFEHWFVRASAVPQFSAVLGAQTLTTPSIQKVHSG